MSTKPLMVVSSLEPKLIGWVSELDMISKPDGTREQLAEWWIAALASALQQIDPKYKSAVTAIGVSGQQHGFVPVAADGRVLAPVKLWCDTSTTAECDEIALAMR